MRRPAEVCQEMLVGGPGQFAVAAFESAHWLQKNAAPVHNIAAVLLNSLQGNPFHAPGLINP